MRKIILLGSTGSIGASALKVVSDIPERVAVLGMAAHSSAEKLARQANRFRPSALCLVDESQLGTLRGALEYQPEIYIGEAGLIELAKMPEADMLLVAIVGTGGLRPTLAAIESGKDIAVASKEILVMAGKTIMAAAQSCGVNILPVDSEHNAIFQCLEGRKANDVRRIILTASGGPFRTLPAAELEKVTLQEALQHPTWSMGRKITIDSATLFNKGLEMIEARWLFGVEISQIEVVVHPQSIVHSMVEFTDASILAQLSHSDMCFPIQYAITWPERVANSLKPLDFHHLGSLDFEAPRERDFPALTLARQAGELGATLPAVFNAANEVAVDAFIHEKISFPGIWRLVEETLAAHSPVANPTLDAIIESDAWARKEAANRI